MATPIKVETLTQIWQRVLGRNPIGSEENFFDLGENDSLADLLFTEIASRFGRQVPSAAIEHAPTIAALAALLQQPTLPAFRSLIQMKPGSESPPVFIVHGLDGSTAQLFNVVMQIQTKHPIYGIQAKGIDGFEKPLERVEDMAKFYLSALEEVEPRGPYLLIGYSFGGLVALEMAQQLSKVGGPVHLLILLDTYPDARSLAPAQRLRLIGQRVKFHLEAMRRLPLSEAPQYFIRKLEARRRLSTTQNKDTNGEETHNLSFAEATFRVEQKAYVAMANYRPRFYDGKIHFVLAAHTKSYFLPPKPALIWRTLAQEFELSRIPGGHIEMVKLHSDALASILTRYIEEATASLLRRPATVSSSGRKFAVAQPDKSRSPRSRG